MNETTKRLVTEAMNRKLAKRNSALQSRQWTLEYRQRATKTGRSKGARTAAANEVPLIEADVAKLAADVAAMEAAIAELRAAGIMLADDEEGEDA